MPRIARPIVDLPDPDSPTMPNRSRPTAKLTFRTASTGPCGEAKVTERPSTSSRGTESSIPGIQYIAQSVPSEVEGKASEENRSTGNRAHPPLIQQKLPPGRDHGAPFRSRRLRAQSKKSEAGCDDDDARHI